MKNIAQTYLANLGTRVLYTTAPYNSFDTHAGELANHTRLWTQTSKAIADFYADLKEHDASDNVVLLVVGDVGPEEVFPLVETHYGAWKKGPTRPPVPAEPPQPGEKRVPLGWKGATLPMLLMGFHGPAFSTTQIDGPAMEVLAASSRIVFWKLSPLPPTALKSSILVPSGPVRKTCKSASRV